MHSPPGFGPPGGKRAGARRTPQTFLGEFPRIAHLTATSLVGLGRPRRGMGSHLQHRRLGNSFRATTDSPRLQDLLRRRRGRPALRLGEHLRPADPSRSSALFPAGQNYINPALPFINPPVFAWLIAPLTALPLPVAYALWCAISLAALVWAWHLAAPYSGLRKIALLLAALALWPVLDAFYFGQPSLVIVGLLATSWWLCSKDRPLAAGAALALATALKPHTVFLVPLALAVSGRFRPFLSWAAVCSLLAIACVVALGPSGLNNWLQTLEYGQTDTGQAHYTLAYIFGTGPLSYALEGLQGVAALVIAWRRRADLNIVFALGILGSLVFAFHLHQYDYAALILAAWLVLRTGPALWHRLWLLLGVAPMQTISVGNPLPQLAVGLRLAGDPRHWRIHWRQGAGRGESRIERSPGAEVRA